MKTILYINGSPRGEKGSSSAAILKDLASLITLQSGHILKEEHMILPRSLKGDSLPYFKQMDEADVWIFSMPLYVDCLPGHLTWWLREYEKQRGSERAGKRVYGIVNSGFPEAVQNRGALKILKNFCDKNGFEWRIGIGLGMGDPYKELVKVPLKSFLKKPILEAFTALAEDLGKEEPPERDELLVSMRWPVFLYKLQGNLGWPLVLRKNGRKRREIYARPYQAG